jgi:protocatechuate 3,4-dioxygenase beta subunit
MRAWLAVLGGVVVVAAVVAGFGLWPLAEPVCGVKDFGGPEEKPATPKGSGPTGVLTLPEPPAPARPEARPERGLAVEGVVLDAEDRHAIAGARVEAREGGVHLVLGVEDSRYRGRGAPPVATATSGPDGRFRLEPVPPGLPVTVAARAAGYAEARDTVKVERGAEAAGTVELLLPRAGLVRGIVLDPEGRPLPAARVYAVPDGVPSLLEDPRAAVTVNHRIFEALDAKADEQGRFELGGVPLGALQLMIAAHPDHVRSAPVEVRLAAGSPEAAVELRLQRWGTLVVQVVDAEGRPAVPGEVRLFPSAVRARNRSLERASDGSFPRLVPGPYQVEVLAGDTTVTRDVDVPGGPPTEVIVRLSGGSSLAGRLVDDRGAPIAETLVTATPDPRNPRRVLGTASGSSRTDGEGRFRIAGLETGLHQVFAPSSEDHEAAILSGVDAPQADLSLVARRRARVTARLVLPAGAAAPEGVKVVKTAKGPGERSESVLLPWRDGRLEVPGFPPGPARVEAIVEGLGSVARDLDAVPGQVVDLGELRIETGIALEGRVVDAQGAAVAGVEVARDQGVGAVGRIGTVTDREGRFRLEHVAPGEARLILSARGFATAGHVVPVRAGEPVTVRFERGGLLKGEVADENGRPVAGIGVVVFNPNAAGDRFRTANASTDPLGRFELRLPAGNYRVSAWRGTSESAFGEASLREGEETPVALQLKK